MTDLGNNHSFTFVEFRDDSPKRVAIGTHANFGESSAYM